MSIALCDPIQFLGIKSPLLDNGKGEQMMSQARVCDKCHKVLMCNPSVKIEIDFHYNETAEYELCEECKLKLIKWLRGDNNERT